MYSTKIYSEVYYVLSKMEKNIVMMIPIEILEHIKKLSNLDIKNKNDFDINNLEYDSAKLLTWLFYNFIATKDEKQKVDAMMESFKRYKFNPDNLFSNNTISKDNALEKNIETSNQLIIVKESKIKIFFNRILSFFGLK